MRKQTAGMMMALILTSGVLTGCGSSTADVKESEVMTETQVDAETAAQETFEEETAALETEMAETETESFQEIAMYALDDVYMRAEMDAEAEAAAVVKRGSQVTVTAMEGDWCKVSVDGQEGYIMKKFLTESEEEALQAVQAQEAAEEAARQAAAAAQQQAQSSEKYEVSRQKFDDCDGSGHGYAIITYSDGSTETVEY